jgi:hypothetical protein
MTLGFHDDSLFVLILAVSLGTAWSPPFLPQLISEQITSPICYSGTEGGLSQGTNGFLSSFVFPTMPQTSGDGAVFPFGTAVPRDLPSPHSYHHSSNAPFISVISAWYSRFL